MRRHFVIVGILVFVLAALIYFGLDSAGLMPVEAHSRLRVCERDRPHLDFIPKAGTLVGVARRAVSRIESIGKSCEQVQPLG